MQAQVMGDKSALARAGADEIVRAANQAVAERGRFLLVLSGGSTPLGAYALLGAPPLKDQMPWDRTHLFWGDERCVAADDPLSNQGAALKALGPPPELPKANLHAMPGVMGPVQGAAVYQERLQGFFGNCQWPVFDLVLLGLGPDGHVASLFPRSEALEEKSKWVTGARAPDHIEPGIERISLTLPVINQARAVLFMVSGPDKAQVVHDLMYGTLRHRLYPASRVQPRGGLLWLLDGDAAGRGHG